MTAQDLKNSILQLAVQGKLVEQKPEEGTARELIKHSKFYGRGKEIEDDEKPYDIPDSWCWVRLVNIGDIVGGGTPKTSEISFWQNGDIPWLTPADMRGLGKYVSCGERKITQAGLKNSSAKLMPKGTVIYSSRAPIGYIGIALNELCTNQGFKSIVPFDIELSEYLYYCLISRTQNIISRASGTTFKEISGSEFGQTIIPIPPLKEQKRIVAKIEELMPYIDRYEQAWSRLEDFNKRFSDDIKKSILQMAIQGKLVEQRPEEGTAEELYLQIQMKKKQLIMAGKIKKEKPLPEITEDETPFDIPKSWKWVRFGSIMINRDAERVPLSTAERNKLDKIYDYYGASGVIDKVDKYLFDKKLLLIGEDGANLLARSTPIAYIAKGQYWVNNHAHVLDCIECLLSLEYVMYFINAISLAKYVTGTAQPKMNQEKMNSIPIALPPLAEQKRIVAKLEELLPLCGMLKRG